MIAVCSPDYLDNRSAFSLKQLAHEKLLLLNNPSHLDDWETFFGKTTAHPVDAITARYNSFMVYLQAALSGQGVMLGWTGLLDDLIDDGKLVYACDHRLRTSRGYFACLMPYAKNKTAARQFFDWICGINASNV